MRPSGAHNQRRLLDPDAAADAAELEDEPVTARSSRSGAANPCHTSPTFARTQRRAPGSSQSHATERSNDFGVDILGKSSP
jgi:hypothetical protein